VPLPTQLEFFGDGEYARLSEAAVAALEAQSSVMAPLDFAPFLDAAKLLYEGHVGGRALCCN
jgi:allophanate hydrolase